MLKDGARIVVLAEQEGPPPAWYHHMWDLMQDTPFTFQSVAQMSCELLRGQQDNDLFLVNHWLQAPLSPGLDDLRSSRSGMHFLRARSARGGTPFRPRRCAKLDDGTPTSPPRGRRRPCDRNSHVTRDHTPGRSPHRTLCSCTCKRTGKRSLTIHSANTAGASKGHAGENSTVTFGAMPRSSSARLAHW